MDSKAIRLQSEAAYGQWCVQWREHAKFMSRYEMKHLSDFENSGVGRAILCVANGYSFEENLEMIKKHQHNVDIMACDKTFGHLVSNGIKPKYLLLCDANVNFSKYLEPYLDKVQGTIIFSNVCGNPKWIDGVNWKDKYFFVNKDILHSEKEFCGLSGCKNIIPAATNVSNAMVVFLTQSDESGRRNYFGYDKIMLIGFDYSWRHGKKYYSFDSDGANKSGYMCHAYITTDSGEFAYTSGNLAFSANWLSEYARVFRLPLLQCSRATITRHIPFGDIGKSMQYSYRSADKKIVQDAVKRLKEIKTIEKQLTEQLARIGRDHWFNHVATS